MEAFHRLSLLRKLEVGNQKSEVGSWKLEVGSWKLEVGRPSSAFVNLIGGKQTS